MKNNTFDKLLIAVIVPVQFFLIRNEASFDLALPFLSELTSADTIAGNMFLIMYAYLPFPFFLLYFSGKMRNLTEQYGLLITIRGNRKGRLVLMLMGKTLFVVIGIASTMGILYTIGRKEQWIIFDKTLQIQGIILYTATITLLIQMQFLLELYMESHYAFGITTLWGVIALFASGSTLKQCDMINLILFPNLAFAQKNGVLNEMEISASSAFMIVLVIYLVFTALILYRIRKRDMI